MRPRVLHVSAVDFTAAKLLAPQMAYLQEVGYDVRVTCGKTDDAHWSSLEPFKPYDLSFPRSFDPRAMLASSFNLRRVVHEWSPHILHVHTPAASLPVRALPRAFWPRDLQIVYTVHGYLHQWPPTGGRERLIQHVENLESRRTDLTLFQSSEDFEEAKSRGYRGNPTFLGNGVEDEWFNISDPDRSKANMSLLFVGRLVAEKGILDLLAALESTPGVELHIAGDSLPSDRDSVAEAVRTLVRQRLAGRVHLHGLLSKGELQSLLSEVDAVCLPSYREGVPRSVIEALAAGRPVLGARIRGIRELVRHGSNGLLFDAGDTATLSRQIHEINTLPRERFAAMSQAARESVDPTRRESEVFRRLQDAYRGILAC